MAEDRELYTRQRRLLEVGDRGQARIENHVASIAAYPGSIVELAYLERAGVQRVTLGSACPQSPFEHRAAFHFGASAAFAEGAWRALKQLREALLMEKP